jgi:hypothetical protein
MFLIRLVAVLFILSAYCTVVFAVWLGSVMRAILAVAWRTTISAYSGTGTADFGRIERLVLVWPNGLFQILGILAGKPVYGELKPEQPMRVLLETLVTMLFFTWMVFSLELAKEYVPLLVKWQHAITPYFGMAWDGLWGAVRHFILRIVA